MAVRVRDVNKDTDIIRMKDDILKRLYNNPNIIQFLDNDEIDPETPDTAVWHGLYPYIRIPGIQEEVHAFIGVELDSVYQNEINRLYREMQAVIYVVCAEKFLKVDGEKGIRTDILADEIVETLNHNNRMGFTFQLYDLKESVFENPRYYYRRIRFRVIQSNTMKGGRTLYQDKI